MGEPTKEAEMLKDKAVAATLAVRDLDRAREFYEQTLGLEPVEENPGAVTYRAGPSFLLVYPSEHAGTNQATGATWGVGDDFDAIVEDLRAKGVTFEEYDLPEMTREGDVHVMGDLRAVWFKDPDGNIVALVNQAT
jgi:catechol 2,3-dioxygenase-like lactoylglutathione lyase family enzyme